MNDNAKHAIKVGLVLAVITCVCLSLVFTVDYITKKEIAEVKEASEKARFIKLLPPGSFNNNPNDECYLTTRFTRTPTPFYVARKDNQIAGYIVTYDIEDGYSTPFVVVAGINADFSIYYLDVIEFNETPGLGDKILRSKSNFLDSFQGASLTTHKFDVKKYGGDFDYFTGATVTPRAVTRSTEKMLRNLRHINISNLPRCAKVK